MSNFKFDADHLIEDLKRRYPHQPEYHQAVEETLPFILSSLADTPDTAMQSVVRRILLPERDVHFTIAWRNGEGKIEVNQGFRVQHNGALGPYKGGLRFHPGITPSVLHFLAFEQTFKNALTGLPLGGGKGGADFDPKGRSDADINRFCNAFMGELVKHIGEEHDVPAGDINVGERELGFLFGAYRRLRGYEPQILTGKPESSGGNVLRSESTGFGLVLFTCAMLKSHNDDFEGKRVLISGAGNVAIHAALQALDRGARVLTLSDSKGTLYCEQGLTEEAIRKIKVVKDKGGALSDCEKEFGADYCAGEKPWGFKADIALPCATQNELDKDDAERLVENGIAWLAEGANMPCTLSARAVLRDSDIVFAPGKAANAGGVAMSGYEMAANRVGLPRNRADSLAFLEKIMCEIHDRCVHHSGSGDKTDYAKGATIAGFDRVAEAMLRQGVG